MSSMTASPTPPYGSARDLPSFREMQLQLKVLSAVGIFLSPTMRKEMRRIRRELEQIADTVDSFYALLGPRNWVFTDDLNLDDIRRVIDTDDPEEAERRFISYYQRTDRLEFPLRRLNRFDAMRPRMAMLENAARDYDAQRYYSCVLVLLAMMDGFVNDFDVQHRKGLHARSDEEMVAWDRVAGHHLGLGHAHRSFVQTFKKLVVAPVTELHRHGIMHGMMPDIDNEVVATKAWNRLFAVADWADARVKQAAPVDPTPTVRESIARYRHVAARKKLIDDWSPYTYDVDDQGEESEVVATCTDFLTRWQMKQWGPLGTHFLEFGRGRTPIGKQAQNARSLFEDHVLSSWAITRVRHEAAAVARVEAEIVVGGKVHLVDLRWVRVDSDNETATDWEEGRWALSPYGPSMFRERKEAIQDA